MKSENLQKVFYVSCDEFHVDHRSINFKGLYSTIEKALTAIMDDIDTEIYDVSGTRYKEITVANVEKVIESGDLYIITAKDNGKNNFLPCLHIESPSIYYFINLIEIH